MEERGAALSSSGGGRGSLRGFLFSRITGTSASFLQITLISKSPYIPSILHLSYRILCCLLQTTPRRKPRCHQICDALCNPTVEDIFGSSRGTWLTRTVPEAASLVSVQSTTCPSPPSECPAASHCPAPGRLRWLGEPPLSSPLFNGRNRH